MYFKHVTVEGLGCFPYVIGRPAARVCCVVDPKREVKDYIDIALKNEIKLTHIFETHMMQTT